jgi:SAM-dependent methyltransferase
MANTITTDKPDFKALTEAGRAVWSSGDFNAIARQVMAAAEDVVQAADPRPGQSVLDVACGSGNAALVAARRYCAVSGIDIAPNLVERARTRAAAEGVEVEFREGDAQALPYPDAHFDVVLSVFGVMFAPDQERAASELRRVCRPGGRIVLANWMPEAFGAYFFGAHARHAPPPPGMPSPLRWGTTEGLTELLGSGVRGIATTRRSINAYYPSVEDGVDLFARYFGPTIRALNVVGPDGAEALRRDISAVFDRYNRADDGTAVVETEYLRVTATRA